MRKVSAFWLLYFALIGLVPGFLALSIGGFSGVLDWPLAFFGLFLAALGSFVAAVVVYLSPRRVGMDVVFEEGGFSVVIRRSFANDRSHRIAWRDVEEVKLVEVRPGANTISFRLSHEAAVRHGLIQPTTRASASKMLVKREITLPTGLCSVSVHEAFDRFNVSAQHAGAKLIETLSSGILVSRTVWSVEWSDV